ncbi:unnamed protein product [Ceutorhynchus assimilis]|uniref:Retrotransposon gag domain-containing protein n=1 Tax=Ceutorhynchus assimilis TaxID=467358 RepID=A0A9N9N3G8_9CUCU|nr:unnamed protein product [Ceutorhynchus assimilis]
MVRSRVSINGRLERVKKFNIPKKKLSIHTYKQNRIHKKKSTEKLEKDPRVKEHQDLNQIKRITKTVEETSKNIQTPPSVANLQGGTFSKCASRFDGSKNADVNAFLSAIEIYKEYSQVSDDNALRALSMLFDGFAATYFRGIKSTLITWNNAVDLLRRTFGPQKPRYRVYRELFAEEQPSDMKTDVFIYKCRAIIAQLPPGTLTENIQMDS